MSQVSNKHKKYNFPFNLVATATSIVAIIGWLAVQSHSDEDNLTLNVTSNLLSSVIKNDLDYKNASHVLKKLTSENSLKLNNFNTEKLQSSLADYKFHAERLYEISYVNAKIIPLELAKSYESFTPKNFLTQRKLNSSEQPLLDFIKLKQDLSGINKSLTQQGIRYTPSFADYDTELNWMVLSKYHEDMIKSESENLKVELSTYTTVISNHLSSKWMLSENLIKALFLISLLLIPVTSWLAYKKISNISGDYLDETEALKFQVKERESFIEAHSRFIGIGEVATTLAHEIKNPLQSIITATGLIKKLTKSCTGDATEDVIIVSDKIEKITYRISTILKDVQKLAYDAKNDDFTPHQIENIIKSSINVCYLKAKDCDVRLRYDEDQFASLKKPEILCRESQIIQALTNIISNGIDAAKHTEARWVELKVETTADSVILDILDSGEGVPKDLVKKIMQPYFTTKKNGEGTGIGLSHTKEILKIHDGDLIYLENEVRTTFRIQIPLYSVDANNIENGKMIA